MGDNPSIDSALREGLAKLSMLNNNGLSFVENINNEPDNYIKIHLLEAKKYHATAVYFKYFENRPPTPQIYIYEENKLNKDINDLHKELWSSCKVPMFFVFSKIDIKIFNSLSKETKKESDIKPIEIIKLSSKIKKEFDAKMFDTGAFWNTSIAKKNFSYSKSAYKTLLDSLKLAREHLIKQNILPEPIINSLLMKSILLRYLEEREVFKEPSHPDKQNIKEDNEYWKTFAPNAQSFIDVCEYGKDNSSMLQLFQDLATRFNGGIFKFSIGEEQIIINADLTKFILFLRGDVDVKNLQRHFWDLYSFKDLPIELISNIYELFLKNQKGVVYTPSILVDFLIDETMPLNTPKESFKIIDPSCGSGIFLVGAYKRLVEWWRINHNLTLPDSQTLKQLIQDNIYGIDEKSEAVELAKFSLTLALCDTLSPEAIWNELHFDDLTQTHNLIVNDFFNILDNKEYLNSFDLVIGNPPFVSELTTPKSVEVNQKSMQEHHRPNLPDNQLALLFLEQSFKLLKKDCFVCMIQPSAFLYNNNVEKFRQYLFNTFDAKQIIDFAGLNSTLFKGSADVAVSVAFFQNRQPNIEKNELLHLTMRQTFESREKIYFDLSYYDFHWINYKEAIDNKYIWKCNLLGGGRVADIVNKLNKYDNLETYFSSKEKSSWYIAEGFQLNGKDRYKENHTADYITGHLTLPAEAFSEDGIDNTRLYIIQETHFHRPRPKNKKIFEPPHLLIKEKLGSNKIVCEFRNDYLTFTHDTIGIHAPLNEKDELLELEKRLKNYSLLYLFYLASTSSQAGASRATSILKNDIMKLPYPSNNNQIIFSKIDEYIAVDTLEFMFHWIKGNKSLAIFKDTSQKQLQEYQEIYCEVLNSIYEHYQSLDALETEQFIISIFYYQTKPTNILMQNKNLDTDLETLIHDKIGESLYIKKILKIYDGNVIYIIKPKQYRFWLKSIAVRDADDTFADLVEMRYYIDAF